LTNKGFGEWLGEWMLSAGVERGLKFHAVSPWMNKPSLFGKVTNGIDDALARRADGSPALPVAIFPDVLKSI
jgi:hypothetical protein